jgi:uncharacterized protein (DUF1778 family)
MKTKLFNMRTTEGQAAFLAEAAKVSGRTKTDFIFFAAIEAAKKIGIDVDQYFVSEANATPQNMGAKAFLAPKEIKKLAAEQTSAWADRGAIAEQRPHRL